MHRQVKIAFVRPDQPRVVGPAIEDRRGREEMPVVLVGNKVDLEQHRQVTTAEGKVGGGGWRRCFSTHSPIAPQALADRLCCCAFFETSAKTLLNVEEVFHAAIRHYRVMVLDGFVSVGSLAQELVVLMLLAQRRDAGSWFARLPRDVVLLIGRRLVADSRD